MILAAASLLAALQAVPAAQYEHYPRKEMRAKVEACGFAQVWVGRNKAKREVIRVKDQSAADDQLVCAAKAMDPTFYASEFAPELAERFAKIRAAIARPRVLAEARARFARSPEMGPPPERLPDEGELALAKRIEAFCGPAANGAFTDAAGRAAISGQWMQERSLSPDAMVAMAGTLGCIIQASIIADIEIGGPGLG